MSDDHDDLVAQLEAAGCVVRGHAVTCAFHGDKNASGSIYIGSDGRSRYKCHACEAHGDAADIQALRTGQPIADVLKSRTEVPMSNRKSKGSEKPRRKYKTINDLVATVQDVVAVYDYSPSSLRVIRTKTKAFPQAHQDEDGTWCFGGVADPQPIYHSADLGDGVVVVVEGERDADAIRGIGLFSTTAPMGADSESVHVEKDGKPGRADWSPLAGRHVVIWGDADAPGQRHGDRLERIIGRVKPASIRRVTCTEHKDAADLIAAHGDGARAAVDAVLAAAVPVAAAPHGMVGNSTDMAELAEQYLGRPINKCEKDHSAIVLAVLSKIRQDGLAADATGALRWRNTWELAAVELGGFCREITFILRRDMAVQASRVQETAEEILHRDAQARRQLILGGLLGKPRTDAGEVELRKWVRAVTGQVKEADVQCLRHWMHSVKRKQAGRQAEQHVMPVVVGPQGSGKSEAVRRLVAPWQELADLKVEATMLTDERSRPALVHRAIGVLDELAGLSKADAAELKATITAAEVGYRPMRSNDRRVLPMLMSFIGTSNVGVAELVHDLSGARRFYELRTPARCDWATINAIDYNLVWQSVNEDEPAPGVVHRDIIAAEQKHLVWRDQVERWLDEETFGPVELPDRRYFAGRDPVSGVATAELWGRMALWCQRQGEKVPSSETMGRRLLAMGWEQYRPRIDGVRVQCYRLVSGGQGTVRDEDAYPDQEPEKKAGIFSSGQGGQGCQGRKSFSYSETAATTEQPEIQKGIEDGHPDHPDHPDRGVVDPAAVGLVEYEA